MSTSLMAWMGAAMLLAQAALGLIRADRPPFRTLHVAFGMAILPLIFVHAWLAMRMLPPGFAHAIGLRLASAALLLLMIQLLTGTALVHPSEHSRLLGKLHFAVAVGIVCLAGVHVLLTRY